VQTEQSVDSAPDGRLARHGWIIVAVCTFGISTGPAAFAFGSAGQFIGAFHDEFGWDRTEVSFGLLILTGMTALSLPFIGRLIDRYGARHVLIPSLVLFAACLAAIPLFVRELWQLNLIYVLMGTLAAGTNSVPFVRVISAWFDRSRGLAIGIAGSGTGLGFAYVPLIVEYMTTHHGWRSAYYALAAVVLAVTVPLVVLLLREKPADVGLDVDGAPLQLHRSADVGHSTGSAGYTLREAYRRRDFWVLIVVFVGLAFVVYGVLPHLVPLLRDRGIDSGTAAVIASMFGLSAFVGRVVIGWLIDHFFARNVALVFFALSGVGLALLNSDVPVWLLFVAAALVGGGLGAEVDLLAYLTSRYFGLRCFSEIFGVLFGAILVSIGVGPVVFGLVHDRTQSYADVMYAGIGLCAVAVLVMVLLRPYPKWSTHELPRA
jgi:sugar phosphate permease